MVDINRSKSYHYWFTRVIDESFYYVLWLPSIQNGVSLKDKCHDVTWCNPVNVGDPLEEQGWLGLISCLLWHTNKSARIVWWNRIDRQTYICLCCYLTPSCQFSVLPKNNVWNRFFRFSHFANHDGQSKVRHVGQWLHDFYVTHLLNTPQIIYFYLISIICCVRSNYNVWH